MNPRTVRSDGRPAFVINNHLYVSAGVILYTIIDNQIKLLVQRVTHTGEWADRCYWEWEDFGGKSDIEDESIVDTAVRECYEELNYLVDKGFIKAALEHSASRRLLNKRSKYVLFLGYVPPTSYQALEPRQFGQIEHLTQIQRVVAWVDVDHLFEVYRQHKLHPRLSEMFSLIKRKLSELPA